MIILCISSVVRIPPLLISNRNTHNVHLGRNFTLEDITMFEAGAFLGHFSYLLAKVYCNLDLEENLENLTLEIILRREFPALSIEKNGQGFF